MQVKIKIPDWLLKEFNDVKDFMIKNPKINEVVKINLENLTPERVFAIGLADIKHTIAAGKGILISQETGKRVDIESKLSEDGENIVTKIKDGSS